MALNSFFRTPSVTIHFVYIHGNQHTYTDTRLNLNTIANVFIVEANENRCESIDLVRVNGCGKYETKNERKKKNSILMVTIRICTLYCTMYIHAVCEYE